MEQLNEKELRLLLVKGSNYDVDKAEKLYKFIVGEQPKEPVVGAKPDGIYLIDTKGNAVLYDWKDTESININDIVYVGIVQGSHSVAIALHDVSEDEITLTSRESKKSNDNYIVNYEDSVHDFNGKGNTERLKQIGLNPSIQLKDGEYIPTLAELYLICLNRKAINAAMRFVGGQELADWYWSSTEYSATIAWVLYLSNGNAYYTTKATGTYRVRLVKQFL